MIPMMVAYRIALFLLALAEWPQTAAAELPAGSPSLDSISLERSPCMDAVCRGARRRWAREHDDRVRRGPGQLWMADVRVEVVGPEVRTTSGLLLRDHPINLDFAPRSAG
jgi:hypothetical protein